MITRLSAAAAVAFVLALLWSLPAFSHTIFDELHYAEVLKVTLEFDLRQIRDDAELREYQTAVLRRANKQAAPAEILRVGSITLDRTGHIVQVNNQVVDLTPSEFELLATLMATPGRAFSRLDLLESTSGDAFEGYERTIDVHIRNLRAKVEPDPSNPRYIQTVYGMGYRFAVE